MTTRGFTGRRPAAEIADRIPPGQSLTQDFPVLSAGPTPRVLIEDWSFTLKLGPKPIASWNWDQFNALPQTRMTRDIHCVTKWSKLNTPWQGVTVDDILLAAGIEAPRASLWLIPMMAIPPMFPRRISSAARRWWRCSMKASRWPRTMAGRRGCWCRISISGNRPNG